MSYCEHCGQQIDDSVQFCPNCGAQNTSCYSNIQQPVYDASVAPNGVNAMAIVGMALAGTGIPGIILSSIGRKRAASGQYRYPLGPLATAGLVVSIIMTVIWFLYIIIFALAVSNGV